MTIGEQPHSRQNASIVNKPKKRSKLPIPWQPSENCITPSFAACHCSWYDFCISILNLDHNQRQWKVLQAKKLDSWNEYTLLRIDEADIEPIYLLKMTCPSTGRIHVLRTPSNMKSAREAICWVNWGVAPEDFAVQT